MPARSSRLPSRTTSLLAVAAAHGLLLWIFWRAEVPVADEAETLASVMFFLPEPSRAQRPTVTPPRPTRTQAAGVQPAPLIPWPQATEPGTAISPPAAPGAAVDWSAELAPAADATLKKEKQAREQLGALTRRFMVEADPRNPGRTANHEFRWYNAGIHRIDTRSPIPVLHLNDRCVMIAFIFPVCAIGHIEIHGDLFQNMAAALDENEATARPNDLP